MIYNIDLYVNELLYLLYECIRSFRGAEIHLKTYGSCNYYTITCHDCDHLAFLQIKSPINLRKQFKASNFYH